MSTKSGGPAFPQMVEYDPKKGMLYEGMSLRDYFAAKAMQAMTCIHSTYASGPDNDTAARRAYALADAMLAVRMEL